MFEDVLKAATNATTSMALLDAAALWHRMESASCARKLAYCGAVLTQHLDAGDSPIGTLPGGVDPADAAEAEIAAALGITCSTAGRWMWLGHTLATRLPNLAAMFADGEVTEHQVRLIADGTANVSDESIKLVEAQILDAVLTTGTTRLVGRKLRAIIDAAIIRIDPDGMRARRKAAVAGRHIHVHAGADGMVEVLGSLTAEDGTFLDRRLDEMAKRVCTHDPRPFTARRADALIALTHGRADLDCQCGHPACPFTTGITGVARRPLVHVIASANTLNGASDTPGWIDGYGLISADHVRDLATDADLRELKNPVTQAVADYYTETPEHQYRPSRDLADWVKAVHGWCAFPGCSQPAWETDLDHRTPRSHDGDTASYNLGPFCRKHHNLHTHGGWDTEQLADGTLILTSPTGRSYRIRPLGPIPLLTDPPARKQPRAKQRAARIRRERKRQREINNEPPPF